MKHLQAGIQAPRSIVQGSSQLDLTDFLGQPPTTLSATHTHTHTGLTRLLAWVMEVPAAVTNKSPKFSGRAQWKCTPLFFGSSVSALQFVSSSPPCGSPGTFHLVALSPLGTLDPPQPAIRQRKVQGHGLPPSWSCQPRGGKRHLCSHSTGKNSHLTPSRWKEGRDVRSLGRLSPLPFLLLHVLHLLNSFSSFKALVIPPIPPLLQSRHWCPRRNEPISLSHFHSILDIWAPKNQVCALLNFVSPVAPSTAPNTEQ